MPTSVERLIPATEAIVKSAVHLAFPALLVSPSTLGDLGAKEAVRNRLKNSSGEVLLAAAIGALGIVLNVPWEPLFATLLVCILVAQARHGLSHQSVIIALAVDGIYLLSHRTHFPSRVVAVVHEYPADAECLLYGVTGDMPVGLKLGIEDHLFSAHRWYERQVSRCFG